MENLLRTDFTKFMVYFGEEISDFSYVVDVSLPTEIFKFILIILNLSDNKSTTHHFARIFQNTSVFNPKITVRRITGNVT